MTLNSLPTVHRADLLPCEKVNTFIYLWSSAPVHSLPLPGWWANVSFSKLTFFCEASSNGAQVRNMNSFKTAVFHTPVSGLKLHCEYISYLGVHRPNPVVRKKKRGGEEKGTKLLPAPHLPPALGAGEESWETTKTTS